MAVQSVLFTPVFERKAAKAGLTDEEMFEIAATLSADPTAGVLVKGSGGLRKLRFARKGRARAADFERFTIMRVKMCRFFCWI